MKINKKNPWHVSKIIQFQIHTINLYPQDLWSYFYCIIHHIFIDFPPYTHTKYKNMMKVNPINALTIGERKKRIRKIKYHASIIECISYFFHYFRLLLIRFSNFSSSFISRHFIGENSEGDENCLRFLVWRGLRFLFKGFFF